MENFDELLKELCLAYDNQIGVCTSSQYVGWSIYDFHLKRKGIVVEDPYGAPDIVYIDYHKKLKRWV